MGPAVEKQNKNFQPRKQTNLAETGVRLAELQAVILGTGHSPPQAFAAEELIKYIRLTTGISLEKRVQDTSLPESCIIIGDHPLITDLVPEIDITALQDDGFWLAVKGKYVIIAASKVRGAVYGVYTFLEDYLGIKFLAPEVVHAPKIKRPVVIPQISRKEIPAFSYRAITYLDALDPDFVGTQKVNLSPFADPAKGGSYRISPGKMTHTFYGLVPPGKYFNDHPEYFSLVHGQRIQALGQLCLTNPEVIRIATETVIRWFEEEPDIMTVGVVQNDWTGYCECEACKRVDRGNPARSLLHFCTMIGNAVRQRLPGKLIHTIAYTYTETPPEDWSQPLPDNLLIIVCNMYPYRSNRPIDGDPMNARYYQNLQGWLKLARHVLVWHYFVDFEHYLLPYPIWQTIAADLKKYKTLGVEGVFLQAGIGTGLYQEFQELKWWVFHKLLWNPNQDIDPLVRAFIPAYFSGAAPAIQRFVDAIQSLEHQPDVSLHLYVGIDGNHIHRDWVVAQQRDIEEALAHVQGDSVLVARVEKVLLMLDYAYLLLPPVFSVVLGKIKPTDLDLRRKVLARLEATVKKFQITSHGEQINIQTFLDRQHFSAQEHSLLAIAELAPLVTQILSTMLAKVSSNLAGSHYFVQNDYIVTALKLGFQPLELSGWMTSRGVARYEPGVPDNWHRYLDVKIAESLLHPPVPNVKKGELPKMVLQLIQGLPNQRDELES